MVKEIGRKEAEDSRETSSVIPNCNMLWIGIIEDVFQMDGKECKDQEKFKMCRRKSMPLCFVT